MLTEGTLHVTDRSRSVAGLSGAPRSSRPGRARSIVSEGDEEGPQLIHQSQLPQLPTSVLVTSPAPHKSEPSAAVGARAAAERGAAADRFYPPSRDLSPSRVEHEARLTKIASDSDGQDISPMLSPGLRDPTSHPLRNNSTTASYNFTSSAVRHSVPAEGALPLSMLSSVMRSARRMHHCSGRTAAEIMQGGGGVPDLRAELPSEIRRDQKDLSSQSAAIARLTRMRDNGTLRDHEIVAIARQSQGVHGRSPSPSKGAGSAPAGGRRGNLHI